MHYEPPLDRARLADAVREQYALDVAALEFVPVGYATACYLVHLAGGGRRFLKLWPDTAAARPVAARQQLVLPLLVALDDLALPFRVPRPLPARDPRLSATLDGLPFALFPYFEGSPAPDWPDASPALQDAMARAIGSLHAATDALDGALLPPAGRLELAFDEQPFEPELLAALDALERVGPGDRPGLRALRDLVLPRRDEVLRQLERLHALRERGLQLDCRLVLCHRDWGGDNLLLQPDGQLVVLDWDAVALAPPEQDLMFAIGARFPDTLHAYAERAGPRPLHLEHFEFYLLLRYVGDMLARLVRLLYEQTSPDEDDELPDGIARWGFDSWARLDERLEPARAALG
jgi:Ser/Thr protein kinase RdoA (MazF antagonist)